MNQGNTSVATFDQMAQEYDQWFDEHPHLFNAEVAALRQVAPFVGEGLEIGVGTGMFAKALGIKWGVEPSREMGRIARRRGIEVIEGFAENLPFPNHRFDYTALITTLCFVADQNAAIKEALRVTKPAGFLILETINPHSKLGEEYLRKKELGHPIYQHAIFSSVEQVTTLVKSHGLTELKFRQTHLDPAPIGCTLTSIIEGYDFGGFVAFSGRLPS